MNRKRCIILEAALVCFILLLQLLAPDSFAGLEALLSDRRGDEAARAVFLAYSDADTGLEEAVRVFRDVGHGR